MAKQNQNAENLVKQIRGLQTELEAIKKGLSTTLGDQSSAISDINSELNKTISAFKKIRNAQNLTLDKQTKQLQETKSLADVYKQIPDSLGSFKSKMMDTLSISQKLSASAKAASGAKKVELEAFASTYNQTLSLATELSSLNKEDTLERSIQNNEIEKSLNLLQTQADAYALINGKENETFQNLQKQIESLKNIVLESNEIANISKETKEVYDELGSDFEDLNKKFKKVATTVEIFFSSFKNAAGMTLIFAGGLVDEFLEVSKSIGGSVTQMTGFKAQVFGVSKILGDEAGRSVTALAENLGNANEVTVGLGISVGVMTNRLGVSGDEAATLVNQFGNLSGLSNETALNTMEAASQLASANGVAPGAVMSDIAKNTEFFALYAKDGGGNIAEAAIQARKLGVDLGTAAKISDNLLDYQTSVQSEMEASVLLGRNLNLNKARELAYAGDSAGAMREALNAAGGINAYNKMDVYQRRAVAEAIGVGADELQKMVANQEHAATSVGKLEAGFSSVYATAEELGKNIAGTAVKGIGGMLIGMKDFKTQVSDAKEGFNFIKDSAKGIGGFLTGNKGAFKGLLDTQETGAIKGLSKGGGADTSIKPKTKGGTDQTSVAKGLKEMGKPGVSMGILNTALAGPAFLLFSLGTPGMMAMSAFGTPAGAGLKGLATGLKGFDKVSIKSVAILAATGLSFAIMTAGSIGLAAVALLGAPAGAGLSALSVGLRALGKAGMAAVEGIAVLGLFGIALIPLAYGLSLLGPIIESVAGGLIGIIESIGTGIATVVGSITTMMTSILPLLNMEAAGALFAVAGGFLAISGALMTFAGASLLATPGMLAVGAFTALGGDKLLGGGESGGGTGGKESGLLEEIKGLRADIKAQPIIVQLDGRQVYMSNLRQQKNKSN